MEDITIEFRIKITGDGSKLLAEHLEEVLHDAVKVHGIITEYTIEEMKNKNYEK